MPNTNSSTPDFPTVRRGFDPDAVAHYITRLEGEHEARTAAIEAAHATLESELADARRREEAVHLTLIAATKTKEELLASAHQTAEETVAKARQHSESVVSEAKKEAFRVVADARQSAEEAITTAREDAKRIKAAAEEAADSTRDAARREAIEMINTVETETAGLVAARETALAELEGRYSAQEAQLEERISALRATAADLETRLKAIATGSLGETATLVTDMPPQRAPAPMPVDQPPTVTPPPVAPAAATSPQPNRTFVPKARPGLPHEYVEAITSNQPEEATTVAAGSSAEVERSEPTGDTVGDQIEEAVAAAAAELGRTLAAEAAAAKAPERVDVDRNVAERPTTPRAEPERSPVGVSAGSEEAPARKGSYYSRRSAKLPRIGTEAGRSALAAANAIRGATRHDPDDDVTAQTA